MKFSSLKTKCLFALIKNVNVATFLIRSLSTSCPCSSPRPFRSHYDVLGLRPDCSSKEIRNAYLKLSKQYHPDVASGLNSEKFREIHMAYSVLKSERKRECYDVHVTRLKFRDQSQDFMKRYQESFKQEEKKDDQLETFVIILTFFAILVMASAGGHTRKLLKEEREEQEQIERFFRNKGD